MIDQEPVALPQVGTRAIRGALVLTVATYLSVLLGVAARKWLAVILLPAVFGVMQAALAFVDLVVSFGSFSFSSAIINVRKNLVAEPLEYLNENIFVLTVVVNGVLSIAAIVIGAIFVNSLGGYIVLALIGVYAVQRFMASLDTFYTQLLERRLEYAKVSQVTLLTNIVLHSASIGIALLGYGPWCIPVATLLTAFISLAFDRHFVRKAGIHTMHAKPWHYWRPKTVKWLWKFGTHVLFNRLFESWLFRIDNILVLTFLGSSMLGLYSQAFAIAQMPAIALAPIVARVSIAAYAEIQHDSHRLEEAFAVTNFFLIRLLVPAALVILFASKDIVRIFLSSSWGTAAAPLAALSGFVLTIPLFENGKMLLGAKLKLKEISIVRASQLSALVLGIVLVGQSSIYRVGLIVSAVSLCGYGLLLFFVSREVALRLVRVFVVPVVLGIASAVALFFVAKTLNLRFLPGSDLLTSIEHLALIIGLVLVMVSGGELLFDRKPILAHVALVRARVGKPKNK